MEKQSTHPLAEAVLRKFSEAPVLDEEIEVEVLVGQGARSVVSGEEIQIHETTRYRQPFGRSFFSYARMGEAKARDGCNSC